MLRRVRDQRDLIKKKGKMSILAAKSRPCKCSFKMIMISIQHKSNEPLTLHVAIEVQLQIIEAVTQVRAHSYLTRVLSLSLLELQFPHALQGVKIKSRGDEVGQGRMLHGIESVPVPGKQSEESAYKLKQSLSSTVLQYNKNGFSDRNKSQPGNNFK